MCSNRINRLSPPNDAERHPATAAKELFGRGAFWLIGHQKAGPSKLVGPKQAGPREVRRRFQQLQVQMCKKNCQKTMGLLWATQTPQSKINKNETNAVRRKRYLFNLRRNGLWSIHGWNIHKQNCGRSILA